MQSKVIDFSAYSSLKIGVPLEVFVIESPQDLQEALSKNLRIIGKANNLLVSPNAQNLAVLGKNFAYLTEQDNLIEIGGAYSSGADF